MLRMSTKFKWALKKNNHNDWAGKYIIAFGDSIIAGQELVKEETPYRDVVYPKLASYLLNARKFDNFAETGTGQFKGQHNLDKITGWTHNFTESINHYKEEVKRADVILIAYGNNDWKQPNPDGSLHTLNDVKKLLRNNIIKIKRINRKAMIVGILETLSFRQKKSAWNLKGPNGFTYKEMLSAYTEVYHEYNIPIFDIRDYHIGNAIEDYVDKRDHFTKIKHQEIAESFADFIKKGGESFYSEFHRTIKIIDIENKLDNFEKINELNTLFEFKSNKNDLIEIINFSMLNNFNLEIEKRNIRYINIYMQSEVDHHKELEFETKGEFKKFNKVIKKDGQDVLLQKSDYSWKRISEITFFDYWLRHYLSTKDYVYIFYKNKLNKIDIVDFDFKKLFEC